MKQRVPDLPPWVLLVAIALILVAVVVLLQGMFARGTSQDASSPASSRRVAPV